MIIFAFILLLSSAYEAECASDSHTLNFLQDYLRNAKQFSSVAAIVCGQKFGNTLARLLQREGFMNSIMEPSFAEIHADVLNFEKIIVIVTLDCRGSFDFLQKASTKVLFGTPRKHWLLLMEEQSSSYQNHLLTTLNIFVNGSVTLAKSRENVVMGNYTITVCEVRTIFFHVRDEVNVSGNVLPVYNMYDIYKLSYKGPWKMHPIGAWSLNNTLINHRIYPVQLEWKRLNGIAIPISIVITIPDSLTHLDNLHNKFDDTSTKMNYHIISYILEVMNASGKFLVVDSWGYEQNGTYDGMVGQILRGEVEIGGTPLLINRQRIEILEYIGYTSNARFRFIFRQPRLSTVRNIFLLPFGATVWISSICLLVLAALLLYCATKYEIISNKKDIILATKLKKLGLMKNVKNNGCAAKLEKIKYMQDSWSDIIFLILGAVCQQGFPVEARGSAGRVVTIFLLFTIIILYTSYSASIVVLLQTSGAAIKTLKDLYESPIKLGLHDIIAERHIFQEMKEPLKKKIYKKIAPPGRPPAFYTMEKGISMIRDGLFAFHVELGSGYEVVRDTFTEDEMCSLYEISIMQGGGVWLVMRKNSPYKKLFTYGLRKTQEFGLAKREEHRWVAKKPECHKNYSSFVRVGLIDVRHALLMFAVGLVLSLILLLIEVIIKRKQKINYLERNILDFTKK